MSKATISQRGGGGGDQGVSSRKVQRVEGPELLHLTISLQDRRSFTEQPAGSNLTEQLLSVVNWHTEMRFLMSCGETSTLLRRKAPSKLAEPMA